MKHEPQGPRIRLPRSWPVFLLALSAAGCSEVPTAPAPVEPSVASISVTSSIGSIVAVGGTAQLAATATATTGGGISAAFSWATSDAAVATVDATGELTAVSAGVVTVSAAADGVTGTLDVTVADADLLSLNGLVGDELADQVFTGIGGSTEAALRTSWAMCEAGLGSGNLTEVRDCVTQGRADLAQSTDPAMSPLVELVGLFLDWIDRFLNLT